ncbi:MAG: oligosaccharide flippase family protein [Bacteroidetes bacterium]|nr:oligosaccharide flippase family protein [Bacteroidota bacterium]
MSGTRKSLGNFFTLLFLFPLTIAVNIIVTRILGPSEKGIFSFLLLLGESMLPILYLGFGVGIIYFLSAEKYKAPQVALSLLMIGLVKGILITGIIYLLWSNQWLGQTAKEIPPEAMLPILAVLPLSGIQTMTKQLFKGCSQFGLLNIITLADQISNALLLLGLVVFTEFALLGAVWAVVIKKIIATMVILFILFRKHRPVWSINLAFIKDCYRYGLKAWVGNMATRANEKFDQLILGFFASSNLLGYYSVAYSLIRFLGFIPQAIAPVLFNMVAKVNDLQKSAIMLAQIHRILILLVGLMAIGLGVSASWLIPWLYGEAFSQAVVPAIILLPGMFAYMASRRVINKFLAANGMPEKPSIVEGVGAVVGMSCYLTLIPAYDIIGAAVGSTAAYLVSTGVAHYFFNRLIPKGTVSMFKISMSDIRWLLDRLMSSSGFLRKFLKR